MVGNVIITGAGSGLGLAAALYLAERGFRVYATVPDLGQQPAVDLAAAENGVTLRVLQLDVTDQASVNAAVDGVARDGGIYAVIHSAGLGLRGCFEDLAPAEIRRLFEVNVFGVMKVTRAVLPHMRAARRGRVLIITSAGGRLASMTLSAYCAAKFALEGFGESLAIEVAPFGIQVSLIAPGIVMTPHFTVRRGRASRAVDPHSPYYRRFLQHERLVDEILQTNRLTPADVAKVLYRALTAVRPRLRYVVGWRVALLSALKRRLPDELFMRAYFRQHERRVQRQPIPSEALSNLEVPGVSSTEYLGLRPVRKVKGQ
jgi:NAD(P)-dependent dehydrogenase (short-subunit alcohol dehydrogenase family)